MPILNHHITYSSSSLLVCCAVKMLKDSRLYAYGYQCVGEHEQVSMEVMREWKAKKCGAVESVQARCYFYLRKAPIPRGKGWHDYSLSSGKILPSQNNN